MRSHRCVALELPTPGQAPSVPPNAAIAAWRCASRSAADGQHHSSTLCVFFIDTVPPGRHLPRGALRQPAPRGPASKFHALKLRVCPVSAVALHQSFSLCPHGVHLLCHLVSVSIHRSGSALGELASPGSGWPCSSQCALPPISAASSHDQARAPGPLWHRPQLLLLLSLLTCVALLLLPLRPTPLCSVSPRCPATLYSCYRPALHVEPILIAPCRSQRR